MKLALARSKDESAELSVLVVLAAVALTFVISWLPVVSWLAYPLRLFTTFIHEAGHALAALVSFGEVHHIQVHATGSGVTMTSGGSRLLIGQAGYLGTTLYGVALLLSTLDLRWAKRMLLGTGIVILTLTGLYAGQGLGWLAALMTGAGGLSLLYGYSEKRSSPMRALASLAAMGLFASAGAWLWMHDGLLTWVLGLGCGLGLLAAGRYTGGDFMRFLVAFLGVQVAMEALHDVFYLLTLSTSPLAHSDAHNMARDFGMPPAFWALFWCCLSALAVGAVFIYLFWRGKRAATR